MSAMLAVRDLKKSFGGIVAVDGVSFDVRDGEILGIIGPNGSGKSTLFNCILGQLRPSGGDVRLDGRAVTGMRPCDLNRLGVSRTFQLLQIFPQLTVRENLILAGQEHQGSMLSRLIGRRDAGLSAAANRMLEFFRLDHLADEQAGKPELRPAEAARRRDGVHGGPRLALLDEPAGGVNLTMLASLRDRLKAINVEQGSTFVVIEHNMEFVMALCNRILVLAEAVSSPRRAGGDPPRSEVIEAYLATDDILRLEDVVAGYGKETILHGLSFGVRAARSPPSSARTARASPPPSRRRSGCCRCAGRIFFDGHEITNAAAPADRRRHLLRAPGAQHLSRAVGAAQSRARRCRGAQGFDLERA